MCVRVIGGVLLMLVLALVLEKLGFRCDAGSLVACVGDEARAGGWGSKFW